ncbi:TraR/DksA family transcriptional regulator [Kordiimonas sp.]|uniref:TraR/DksA family transcriptional regulator n=1 Tax=Kordiimonas sp. TaxID=1970157 RepID=UPI003A8D78B9
MAKDIDWRAVLLSLQSELEALENAASDGLKSVELDQSRVGRLSRSDALQGQAMNRAISASRHQALSRIKAAFIRLDNGEFGNCLQCGEEINKKRLELDPTVAVCTNCSGTSR